MYYYLAPYQNHIGLGELTGREIASNAFPPFSLAIINKVDINSRFVDYQFEIDGEFDQWWADTTLTATIKIFNTSGSFLTKVDFNLKQYAYWGDHYSRAAKYQSIK